ncbi:MAG: VWA domain-containing protein [Chloroflexota bacterium]
MSLTYPLALLGLLALPFFWWLGKPGGAWARGRAWVALTLRSLLLICLVLALAGLNIVRATDSLAVVFLIDASDSMSAPTVEAARQYAADAIEAMQPEDQAAIIVFGSDAVVERPMSPVRDVGPLESEVVSINTDLAEAIRLGLALYPPGAARRMVILSDGQVNVGDAEKAARIAAATGVQIDAVPFSTVMGEEVLVTDVDAPTRLNEGQVFDLTVTVESSIETLADRYVTSGGQTIVEETVSLVEGVNRYTFTLTASQPGLTSFRAQIVPRGGDLFYQNNQLSAFSQVVGPPRVLIVYDDESETTNLGEALVSQGLQVDRVNAAALPADLTTLSNYQSIVLANVPARSLGPELMRTLQVYVRDLGGGLVVSGGPNAYGVGGYFMTPLEETLPVEMQLRDQERLPQLTVVYVIDRSGSMADTSVGGVPKIELAKEAILRSINLLGPLDRVGVVAFDENATWVVDLGPATDRVAIGRQVGTLRAGGGTDIYAGVLAVSRALPNDPGQLRHIVLLTDGGASPEGIADLVEQMYDEHGITFSVIAIGQGYAPFIEDLPDLADGRFHYAYNVDTIPEIFSEETVIATRAYVIENEFFPDLASTSPIMNGISATPSILGYVGTSIKPTAQQILVTDKEDPLLAAWQYGLGRAVAWTSDATGRWAANWVGWPDYARFWSQAVRWTITEGVNQNVEVRVLQEGESVRVVVDALADDGSYLNGLDLEGSVVSPDLSSTPLALSQVAPGRYEGTFEPDDEGAYFVRIAGAEPGSGDGDSQAAVAQTSGWVLAYSPEYRSLEGDSQYLEYLTGLTDGGIIDNPAAAFAHNLRADRVSQPVWRWLLLAAVLLLPFDIAVRRLIITREDLSRLLAWLRPGKARRPAPVESGASRVGALLAVKERAGLPSASYEPPSEGGSADEAVAAPRPEPVSDAPVVERREKPEARPQEEDSEEPTAARLLARKRARREEDRNQ